MEVWQIVGTFVGPSVVVALITFLASRMSRKDAIKDKEQSTEEQFEKVNVRVKNVETKVEDMSTKIDSVGLLSKTQAYDKIRHLAVQYINAGTISIDEYENLVDMHSAYEQLGGNGFLDQLMEDVSHLKKTTK